MAEQIHKRLIEEEMKESYIDYSMSVIVGRALPDVRDGLKPVHRRVLYTMKELGLLHNKPFKKSANVVGTCMAKFHPHGDVAIYDTLVRMAQNFSLRYPLVDGQGNWGSQDGDFAAAQRYTEARMTKLAEEMMLDIEKETVNFVPNYDGSLEEPVVLPSKVPLLLINGSSGIAVGMATNIPPHNLKEIAKGVTKTIEDPEVSAAELMDIVKGPDFPTGGIISSTVGLRAAYSKGRGKILVKARINKETKKEKEILVVTEIPYMVNKSSLLVEIAELVKSGIVQDVSDIMDESDRKGMRIVIEIKKSGNSEIVLNQLLKHTQLQTTFGIIMLALHNSQPVVMGLKDMLSHFVKHREEVIKRRTQFDLDKSLERSHILQGMIIALEDVDNIVKTIKESNDVDLASENLIKRFNLSDKQAKAILEMKLQKLTSLETEKIREEQNELLKLIEELKSILDSRQKILDIIKNDMKELSEKYGDERRTEIIEGEEEIEDEDLIPKETVVVTATHSGYVKRLPIETYRIQKRGGTGVKGTEIKKEDTVEHLFVTGTHDHVLCFSNSGRLYWLKAYQIPEASRYAKGKAIVNLFSLEKGEGITAFIPVKEFDPDKYLIIATKNGIVKKTSLEAYSNPRKGGIIGITLHENDSLVNVLLTSGFDELIIASKKGNAVRFNEKDVRGVGRSASGVRGIRLEKNDEVVGMEKITESKTLLTITENGYGKRTEISDYRLIRRGGKGVINIKTSERNGNVVCIKAVNEDDEVMTISEKGIIIRMPVKDISCIGRNTQGVRIMRLKEGDRVTTVEKVVEEEF